MRRTVRRIGARRITLMVVLALAGLFFWFAGCEGLPKNVANCPITPTPPADLSIVPAAQEPPPPALCGFPLTISSPGVGANVNSPVPFVAVATPPDPIYTVRVYVDGRAVLYTPKTTINQFLWIANGQHTVEVVAEDTAGYVATASTQLNVVGQEPGALNIQQLGVMLRRDRNLDLRGRTWYCHIDSDASRVLTFFGWIGSQIQHWRQSSVFERTLLDSSRRRQ